MVNRHPWYHHITCVRGLRRQSRENTIQTYLWFSRCCGMILVEGEDDDVDLPGPECFSSIQTKKKIWWRRTTESLLWNKMVHVRCYNNLRVNLRALKKVRRIFTQQITMCSCHGIYQRIAITFTNIQNISFLIRYLKGRRQKTSFGQPI